ncbi:GNAT family N-acetyltransferase [Pseudomonas sp. FSL R10-1350]|uniref:GNAT family N-acetyltransferase n=1 Tax=Pseudomonas TaxID=286 RepID=UPI000653CA1E|nr:MULTISPECIES: GNAT family N-acetyltransferase [Pseudomonas]KMN00931.1 acetyltransferase domain protein [Pseudomonas helleri]MQU63057.1 GNAT family N-acetyltransferase [Pseudomonas sp. FSL R10-1350]
MDAPPTLQTQRLILQPLSLADADAIQQRFPHWEVVCYLNDVVPWPYPDDGALSYLRDVALPAMARGEEWHWTLRLRTRPEEVIGSISLMDHVDNHRGFWLSPPWQGQGLMSEACTVVDAYWFETLGREVMRVPKAAPNAGSRRISERGAMRLVSTQESSFVGGKFACDLWEITREQWLAHRARR